jgi:uncharacterized protein
MSLIRRHLTPILERALSSSRIVNVVGPRQDGKTTLVRDLLASDIYLTLDDEAVLRALAQDPYNQIKALSDRATSGRPIVIDEVQRLPEMTLASSGSWTRTIGERTSC